MSSLNILEEHGREVKLGLGVIVSSFYDPPNSLRDNGPTPVRRWRVYLPEWFPGGSWLSYDHAFASLDDALSVLDETGVLEAVTDVWAARANERKVQQAAFRKISAAFGRRDRTYKA